MAKLDIPQTRSLLQKFEFKTLFVEKLGWSQPSARKHSALVQDGIEFESRQIAELAGVVVLEITAKDGSIPNAKIRANVYKQVAKKHHENLLIFLDRHRTQSLWYWVKRDGSKTHPREHLYVHGQPGDLFLSKISAMVFDISEFDEAGRVPVVEVAGRLKEALDVEQVTKKFYREFSEQHGAFLEFIRGIDNERDRRWYASVLLNRLMFIYFLQRKGFVDNSNFNYLQGKLTETRRIFGANQYFDKFLKLLFFEGFAKPEQERSAIARERLGSIRYLNGGLFLPHKIEEDNPKLGVPDKAFENLFALFERYSWNLNDTPGGEDNEINPDVLGYIFEKYINQKAFGAYYTRPEITEYLCEATIYRLVLNAINTPEAVQTLQIPGVKDYQYQSIPDLIMDLDALLCRQLLHDVLPGLSLLDPACGSGAFLVAAMKTLINLYAAIIGKIKFLNDRNLSAWLSKTEQEHKSLSYFIKKRVITDNLYGVDIMEEATEIAKLRLFLALVASAETVEQLEPLPNIDFNILSGNSLIGMMRVTEEDFERQFAQGKLYRQSYRQVLDEKNRLIDTYRHATTYAQDLTALRDEIQNRKRDALATLNEILLDDFKRLGIKYEEATWDDKKNDQGKAKKRQLVDADVEALRPFHWGFEFDEVLNKRGGFDAILTNPPWEVFETNEKEFFQDYVPTIKKKKLRIEDWRRQQSKLMHDRELCDAWLSYASSFPHASEFFRNAPQYRNQQSFDDTGRRIPSKINLYKLFTEQCFNLLRSGGQCGIVIPSGIYTDLGAKQLREMLFSETNITGLFGFENRKEIFDGVHRSYKFIVLTFEKGEATKHFPAAFMRLNIEELEGFPHEGAIKMSVDLIRSLSPDSLSLMEFKNDQDIRIAEKMLRFPSLGEAIPDKWSLRFTQEFNMTSDSQLFKASSNETRLPLFQGSMFHQFELEFSTPKYWIDHEDGRAELLGRDADEGQVLAYQTYRVVHRRIGRNTDQRTLISCVLPPNRFCADTAQTVKNILPGAIHLLIIGLFNSFVVDADLRRRVTAHLDMHFMYATRLPRLDERDASFASIVERAARLTCITPEFDYLAKEVGIKSHKAGATDTTERAKLRAELDGLIAHLYGLTEEEFTYILTTFPLVPDPVKEAARNAYRDVERGLVR